MARKPRTPPPPRRPVQAPRARSGGDPASERRKRLLLLAFAGSGVLMLGLVLGAIFLRGSEETDSTNPTQVLRSGGCVLKTYKGLSQQHVNSLEAKVKYNSFPPTSGPHYGQPALFGDYDDPLVQVQIVHNYEHGGVGVQYGNEVPPSDVAALKGWYRKHPNGLLMGPLPELGDKIALTAWTVTGSGDDLEGHGQLATCTRFDEDAFDAFLEAYQAKGPESCLQPTQTGCIRLEDLAPGS